jgi:hypothetical protein
VKAGAVAFVAALAVCATAAAAVRHVVEKAGSGAVAAEFSYDYDTKQFDFSNLQLTIRRSGVVLVDEPVRPLWPETVAWPGGRGKSIDVRSLDRDPEPEVVLDLYSGGAHCCWYSEVFRYVASANTYLMGVHSWGNVGYRPADLNHDGLREFVSGDDRFAYAFTSFAGSTFPIQIWDYRAGKFVNVTRKFPAAIRRDARRQWRWALPKGAHRAEVGSLAAWTADECMLRHCRSAFRQLEAPRRAHRIGRSWDATPRKFLRHLRQFLRATGYLR